MKCALILATGAAALVFAGCGGKAVEEKAAERMIEQAAKADGSDVDVDISSGNVKISGTDKDGGTVNVNVDRGSATVTSEDGTTTAVVGAAAKIPDDFPKDVPQYAGMEVLAVQQDSASGSVSVTAQSKDAVAKIVAYYKKEAEANGWAQESEMNQAGTMHMLVYTKSGRNLNLVLMGGDDGTQIQLTIAKE